MKKNRWKQIAIAVLAVLLLVFLVAKSFSINLKEHQYYQKIFIHQFIHHENLNKNILKAKYQALISYDPINSSFRLLKEDFEKMRSIPVFINKTGQSKIREKLDIQAEELEQKEQEIERFKTKNAALKNSLRYLPELKSEIIDRVASGGITNDRSTGDRASRELTEILDKLLQNVLLYNMTSERAIALEISFNINQLDRFTKKYALGNIRPTIDLMIQHSRIILDGQYEINNLTKNILDNTILENTEDLEKIYLFYYEKAVKDASLYRFSSYAVSIVLLSWIAYLVIDRLLKINRRIIEMNTSLEDTLQELKRTQTQLIQTEKMSSLGQMVAGVAHEINNPVSFIYSNIKPASEHIQDLFQIIQAYQQEYPDPPSSIQEIVEEMEVDFIQEDLTKILTSMQSGADRIRTIVLSLRNFSRLDESEMKTVDIHEGLESTLVILQNRLLDRSGCSSISVIKNYGNLPKVTCYPSQLNQVFMNILNNAIDAFPDNASKKDDLSSEKLPEPQKTIFITTELDKHLSNSRADRAIIHIRDNGMGISESIQSRIFDPFFTTKSVGKGTGLGLSISYQIIVEKHQGSLQCFSHPGEGTEFYIEIPLRIS